MNSSFIEYFDYYIPDNTVDVKRILEEIDLPGYKKSYITKYSRLDRICVENKLNCYEMFDGLMEKYLGGNSGGDIDFLLFSGYNRYVNNAISVPYYIVGKYKLENASIVSINQGCTSALQALEIANSIVKSNPHAKIMIASVWKSDSHDSRLVWPTVVGDGAGITVISGSGKIKVLDCCSKSDGQTSLNRYYHPDDRRSDHIMELEKRLARNLKTLFEDLLKRNHLKLKDISVIIPQNVSYLICQLQAHNIHTDIGSFFLCNIPKYGHIGDVDNMINLNEAISSGRIKHNDKVIVFSIGEVGENANYVATLLEA